VPSRWVAGPSRDNRCVGGAQFRRSPAIEQAIAAVMFSLSCFDALVSSRWQPRDKGLSGWQEVELP